MGTRLQTHHAQHAHKWEPKDSAMPIETRAQQGLKFSTVMVCEN